MYRIIEVVYLLYNNVKYELMNNIQIWGNIKQKRWKKNIFVCIAMDRPSKNCVVRIVFLEIKQVSKIWIVNKKFIKRNLQLVENRRKEMNLQRSGRFLI